MGLLRDAAIAWNNLQNTTYELLLGWKGKQSYSFVLTFCSEDFPHIAGMQYTTDIDFGLNRAEVRSSKLIFKILRGEIDDSQIEKSTEWACKLRGRLEGIICLEQALDTDFEIYRFDPKRVPHGSRIDAKYVIKNIHTGSTFFVFVDEAANRWFCKSIFQLNVADYTTNQTRLTVLKKEKRKNGAILFSYTHPHYKPTHVQNENVIFPSE